MMHGTHVTLMKLMRH
jgi:hypothetical protein